MHVRNWLINGFKRIDMQAYNFKQIEAIIINQKTTKKITLIKKTEKIVNHVNFLNTYTYTVKQKI